MGWKALAQASDVSAPKAEEKPTIGIDPQHLVAQFVEIFLDQPTKTWHHLRIAAGAIALDDGANAIRHC
jgi:hypothetical protein